MKALSTATLVLGILCALAGPLILGAALGLHSVYELTGDARYAAGALLVALAPCVPLALAVAVSVMARGREDDSRPHLAWIGAGLTLLGLLVPIAGFFLLVGTTLVGVVLLWLGSVL